MGRRRGHGVVLGVALFTIAAPVAIEARSATPPPYKTVRHDEDYSFLSDRSQRSDRFDPVKYIRLSDSRADWFLTLGGEVRQRYERFYNAEWDTATGSDGFLLQRYMVFADLHLGPRFRLFTHLKSALEGGRRGGPRPTDEDRIDLHEVFFDVRLGSASGTTLRLGRQELSFGSQRLVSIRKGPNVPRSFDGVDLVARSGSWRVDAFAARPVETHPGHFDDGSDRGRRFWGVYAVGPLRVFKEASIDLYYLGLDRRDAGFDQGTATEQRETAGARIWRRAAPWDYNVELVYQWGRFGSAPISAWTFASDSEVTLQNAPWRPRFGIKADVTSGDRDPFDPSLQSFNPLFPRGSYFGESALVGPVNHIDLHPSIDLHPLPRLTLNLSWLFFWRESLRDGLYDVPGNLIRSGAGTSARYVGSQPSLVVTWELNRHVTLVADVEYFLAGPFLRETGPGDDLTYAASWLTFTF